MYVCLCKGVTDHDIREAVYCGADNLRAVREHTGVMTQCGKCACLTKEIVDETLANTSGTTEGMFFEVA